MTAYCMSFLKTLEVKINQDLMTTRSIAISKYGFNQELLNKTLQTVNAHS